MIDINYWEAIKGLWSGIVFGFWVIFGILWSIIKVAWPILLVIILIEVFIRGHPSKLFYKRRHKKTYIDENGYKRFSDSDKLVHQWVAEKKLGRELDEEEIVHHKNEDKLDNRPSNLRVFTNQDEHDEEHGYYNEEDDYDYDDDDYDEDFN